MKKVYHKAIFKNTRYIKVQWLAVIFMSLVFSLSCQNPPKKEMLTLAPAETFIYLETQDLGKTLEALTESFGWRENALSKGDFSIFKETPIAFIVAGFETSEKNVTDEKAILNFKPRFTLIAQTNYRESANIAFVEKQIDAFVKGNYGNEEIKFERNERKFVWNIPENGKIVATVEENIIYFGNDETLVEKCLATKRGETDNLLQNQELTRQRERLKDAQQLAFGFVSTEGVKNIANLLGVSLAVEASEEDDIRNFIARSFPNLLKNTTREIVWTSGKTEKGIEDKLFFNLNNEVSGVLKETMTVGGNLTETAEFVPQNFENLSRYNFSNPQIAWRSLILTTSRQMDEVSGKILQEFSGSLLESYGIDNAELFLSSVGSPLITVQFDAEGEKTAVVAEVKNLEGLKKSVSAEFNFKAGEKIGEAEVWKTEDLMLAIIGGKIILGETESVNKCLQARQSGQTFAKTELFQKIKDRAAVVVSVKKDSETALKVIELLGEVREENKKITVVSTTETRFSNAGIEYQINSDFGLLGNLLSSFEDN